MAPEPTDRDDGASPADDDWIAQGHEPGPELTAEELERAPEWEESRRQVAELDADSQLEANKMTYAAILGLTGDDG